MKKYIISSLIITIIVFISILLFIPSKKNKVVSDLVENNMLAFTIDGKSVKEMPKKGEGYFVDSIKCDKGSVVIWDNYNWEIEITEVKNEDSCIIDFTKNNIAANMVTIVKGESVTTPNQYKDTITYNYNGTNGIDGSVQTFTAPVTGNYNLQVWGASGGNSSNGYLGGNGGYSKGTISLNKDDVLYIYIGGKGLDGVSGNPSQVGGYNGGGKSSGTSSYNNGTGGSGGGATHIAKADGLLSTLSTSTSNILLVAGAGGGAANYKGYIGGAGGGTTGTTGIGYSTSRQATAGSQTAGGAPGYNAKTEMTGSFGKGGDAYSGSSSSRYTFSGGGGSGFYGGGGGSGISGSTSTNYRYTSGGGGGSGYINTSLTNALTLDGTKSTIPTVDGTGTETGHTGNGAAVISYDITVNETITPNEIDKVLDSSSKTVTSNGTIVFYPKGNSVLISVTGCDGIIENNKLIVTNVTKNTECKLVATKDITTLYNKILTDKNTISERTDFSTAYTTTNTNTLFKTTENNIIVYYFAGNVTDNWAKFGGFYWRIIRTNSDGSIRLLYHGTSTTATDSYIGTSAFNSVSTNPMYAGYMYGTSGSLDSNRINANNSTIKTTIDEWYKNNLLINYDKYISKSSIYCNDRSIGSGTYSTTSSFNYAPYQRIQNKTLTLNCANEMDRFTVDSSTGNGKLTYPIGLLTIDETSYAGSGFSSLKSLYLYNNSNNVSSTGEGNWWTMSPASWGSSQINYRILGSANNGSITSNPVDFSSYIRPVISLKGDNEWKSGDGSATNPYEIVTE